MNDPVRDSQKARLQARRTRAEAKALRASQRAARLESRRIVADCREARASIEAGKVLIRMGIPRRRR